jgi:hypothetical protein
VFSLNPLEKLMEDDSNFNTDFDIFKIFEHNILSLAPKRPKDLEIDQRRCSVSSLAYEIL